MTKDGLLRLEGWAREGLTDEQIAKNIGITATTLYAWQSRFPKISESLKRGKAPVDFEVENALLKRALGFNYEETTTEVVNLPDGTQRKHIKKVTKMVVPDTVAAIFWLKNRKPDRWKDKREQVVSTKDGVLADLISGLREPDGEQE